MTYNIFTGCRSQLTPKYILIYQSFEFSDLYCIIAIFCDTNW
jgi:hypothetical protein